MRELAGGQLTHSSIAFNFGEGPENVYRELIEMINAQGESYAEEEAPDGDAALEPAA